MRDLPFDVPEKDIGPPELARIAEAVAKRPELWEDTLRETTSERTYVDVFTNDHLGIWAIAWMDDEHDTGYHDHDRSSGAVYVAKGSIRHEQLRLGRRPTGTAVPEGNGFSFDNTFIHRMRREPDAGPTVTIHAYSPPLTRTGQYAEHEDGLLHRIPTDAEEQLVPHGAGRAHPPRTD
ncbi:cysteine dioxygenase [Saccharothrix deserti]|uniref:cysteine dioxygenase n=1 Tax=Saccharothrix deserti TaxID=2593674 RepID=UPI00131DBFCD|nr:cysteine dioxygenase [Saccharothrix deserti]